MQAWFEGQSTGEARAGRTLHCTVNSTAHDGCCCLLVTVIAAWCCEGWWASTLLPRAIRGEVLSVGLFHVGESPQVVVVASPGCRFMRSILEAANHNRARPLKRVWHWRIESLVDLSSIRSSGPGVSAPG